MNYERRKPFEECRWLLAGKTTLPLEWSDEMAYVVGLTATDGWLLTGRRVVNFKSEDRQFVETYLSVLGRTNRIRKEKTHKPGGVVYTTQFGDSRLYRWFESVGLMPRKSLRLGAIAVPDAFLENGRKMFRLEYGKYASIALLRLFYADPRAPRLLRKWQIWTAYAKRTSVACGLTKDRD
jgi:hypothetical protein